MNKWLDSGRTKQKLETRASIIVAARLLLRKNGSLGMDDVARKAKVSRATAYRYFPNVETLILEASLDIKTKSPDQLMTGLENKSIADRVLAVHDHLFSITKNNEIAFRSYLSALLKEMTKHMGKGNKWRGARRVAMLESALNSNIKSNTSSKKLICALSVLVGLESFIVLKDVCGLDERESNEVIKWAIRKLIS